MSDLSFSLFQYYHKNHVQNSGPLPLLCICVNERTTIQNRGLDSFIRILFSRNIKMSKLFSNFFAYNFNLFSPTGGDRYGNFIFFVWQAPSAWRKRKKRELFASASPGCRLSRWNPQVPQKQKHAKPNMIELATRFISKIIEEPSLMKFKYVLITLKSFPLCSWCLLIKIMKRDKWTMETGWRRLNLHGWPCSASPFFCCDLWGVGRSTSPRWVRVRYN